MVELTLEDIKAFSKEYNDNPNNTIIENAITTNGLENACLDRDIIRENQPVFNIELPDTKRYDQKESWKCWIYAGFNMIQYNMAENLNMNLMDFELSSNYIAFFDKLEKANTVYENIIRLPIENATLEHIKKEQLLKNCVTEAGFYEWFASIIKKYGIVPYSYMPNPKEGEDGVKISLIFREKVKKDVICLLEEKKQGKNEEELRNLTKTYTKQNYIFLSKILGEPPMTFNLEYKDKNGTYISRKQLTPIDFKNQYLTLNLDDFVSITNMPMYNKEYNKVYRLKYFGNVYKNSYRQFLNLPIEDLKRCAVKQLKDGIPVCVTLDIASKSVYEKQGILDTRIYNYENTLNMHSLSKREGLDFSEIHLSHCMTIIGVNIVDEHIERWKVEDSYGAGPDEKPNGYYTMNDNYFDKFVMDIIINKKYLTEEQKKMLDQEPIEYDMDMEDEI